MSWLAAANPVSHVVDHKITDNWLFSNVTFMLILTTVVTAAIVIPAARRIATGTTRNAEDFRAQGTLANLVEVICLYLRDEVFKGILKEDTDRFMPILWTFFWFIMVANILGLVPLLDLTTLVGSTTTGDVAHGIGGTATQSIWVTGALAFVAFLLINVTGLIRNPVGYFAHLTGGAPWFMWPIIIPVEFAGIFIKPIALAIRLFANMTGGHMMLAGLFSFVPKLILGLGAVGFSVALVPLAGAT
ncbi:MAG: F0F1 ATP synthase subunit A, partial [Phycisphaeraceae bacterium]|nr:F0F1 ATP synthase subunit A [Phycisphaeraceae bacterium]